MVSGVLINCVVRVHNSVIPFIIALDVALCSTAYITVDSVLSVAGVRFSKSWKVASRATNLAK